MEPAQALCSAGNDEVNLLTLKQFSTECQGVGTCRARRGNGCAVGIGTGQTAHLERLMTAVVGEEEFAVAAIAEHLGEMALGDVHTADGGSRDQRHTQAPALRGSESGFAERLPDGQGAHERAAADLCVLGQAQLRFHLRVRQFDLADRQFRVAAFEIAQLSYAALATPQRRECGGFIQPNGRDDALARDGYIHFLRFLLT